MKPMKMPERLWDKVNVGGEDDCWNWLGTTNRFGYGSFFYKGKVTRAHRVVWEIAHGVSLDRDGMSVRKVCVLHTCDNRKCCNPNHLFLGTNDINVQDKIRKGRQPHGEEFAKKLRGELGSHKVTEQQVKEIRKLYWLEGVSQHELAPRYGICQSNVSRIVNGERWSHLLKRGKKTNESQHVNQL